METESAPIRRTASTAPRRSMVVTSTTPRPLSAAIASTKAQSAWEILTRTCTGRLVPAGTFTTTTTNLTTPPPRIQACVFGWLQTVLRWCHKLPPNQQRGNPTRFQSFSKPQCSGRSVLKASFRLPCTPNRGSRRVRATHSLSPCAGSRRLHRLPCLMSIGTSRARFAPGSTSTGPRDGKRGPFERFNFHRQGPRAVPPKAPAKRAQTAPPVSG